MRWHWNWRNEIRDKASDKMDREMAITKKIFGWIKDPVERQQAKKDLLPEYYEYYDDSVCDKCNGGGLIQIEDELYCCPHCNGSGSV